MGKELKKEYTIDFKICLPVLILGFIEFVISMFAIIFSEDFQYNVPGYIVAIIAILIFIFIPPLVWMFILIFKKKIYVFIRNGKIVDERDNKINDIKEAYNNSDLKIINNFVVEFSNNQQLITIIKNFCITNGVASTNLEFSFLPLRQYFKRETVVSKTTNSKYIIKEPYYTLDSWIYRIESKYDYIKMVKIYDWEMLENNTNFINKIYEIRDMSDFTNTSDFMFKNEYKQLYDLYSLLVHQNIINNTNSSKYSYYAFLYTIYRQNKIRLYEYAIHIYEAIGLNEEDDYKKVAETLFFNDYDIENTSKIIGAVYSARRNYLDYTFNTYEYVKSEVKKIYQDLEEKRKIKKLENNEKVSIEHILASIDLMSGEEFEKFVKDLFTSLGYQTMQTKISGDQGVDVIAIKGVTKIGIQVKCYSDVVGNHAIMEAYSGAKYYNADKAMVITNSNFTKSARELATKLGVVLWDRKVLKEKLEQVY